MLLASSSPDDRNGLTPAIPSAAATAASMAASWAGANVGPAPAAASPRGGAGAAEPSGAGKIDGRGCGGGVVDAGRGDSDDEACERVSSERGEVADGLEGDGGCTAPAGAAGGGNGTPRDTKTRRG